MFKFSHVPELTGHVFLNDNSPSKAKKSGDVDPEHKRGPLIKSPPQLPEFLNFSSCGQPQASVSGTDHDGSLAAKQANLRKSLEEASPFILHVVLYMLKLLAIAQFPHAQSPRLLIGEEGTGVGEGRGQSCQSRSQGESRPEPPPARSTKEGRKTCRGLQGAITKTRKNKGE